MDIGTASSRPGELSSGWLDVTDLPTGTAECLPVVIAEGTAPGPTLWVTGGLHGDEVTSIAAAQDVMTDDLAGGLSGTVVSMPILNPAGVRRNHRNSYYHEEDPNRLFPPGHAGSSSPPSVQELINTRIFEPFAETADALVSLHTGWISERPFTILERVRYGIDRSRGAARDLADRTRKLAEAFGLPVVHEYDVGIQEEFGLQRSFEVAAINAAGIPAITPELGGPQVVSRRLCHVGIEGVRNVMRQLDMLAGEPSSNPEAPASPVDYPVKRVVGPVSPIPGIVRHRIDAGDVVETGDPIADIASPHGRPETCVRSDVSGYILGRRQGVAVYENDPLVSMAARDDGDLLVERG